MIFQILIYGLFISKIKGQDFLLDFFFFFSLEFKLSFKNKGSGLKARVCKFVLQGVQNNFFIKILYIYIYKFGSGGSFEPLDYNVAPPLCMCF